MKRIPFVLTGALSAALFVTGLVAGCGGGGGSGPSTPNPTTRIDGGLSNGDFFDADPTQQRFFDDYLCTATRNARVFVNLHSDDFDPELFVYRLNGTATPELIGRDDDSGDGNDALLEFDVDAGAQYVLRASSTQSNETGFYTIVFSQSLGTPTVVVPGPSAAKLNLPKLAAKRAKAEKRAPSVNKS